MNWSTKFRGLPFCKQMGLSWLNHESYFIWVQIETNVYYRQFRVMQQRLFSVKKCRNRLNRLSREPYQSEDEWIIFTKISRTARWILVCWNNIIVKGKSVTVVFKILSLEWWIKEKRNKKTHTMAVFTYKICNCKLFDTKKKVTASKRNRT